MIFRNVAVSLTLAILGILFAAQFVSVERSNPPSGRIVLAPPQIERTLRRACYDCHSNETRWPWYSRIAPVSWLIVRDVNLARREVNFSDWGSYYPATRRRKLEWVGRSLREEKMPTWTYTLLHPEAHLSNAERAMLVHWVESTLAGSPTTNSSE
jgi:Haem-binding domain